MSAATIRARGAARGAQVPTRGRIAAARAPVPRRYLKLLRRFALRPIRNVREYDEAARVLDSLVLRDDLAPGESDYLAVLTTLVEEYDRSRKPLGEDERTPLLRLNALMRASGTTPAQLGEVIGSRPAASMILAGVREPSKAQIRMLAAYFKLDAGYFF
jgi:antitoxin component HigA of HigAB toxin-antitoxin module